MSDETPDKPKIFGGRPHKLTDEERRRGQSKGGLARAHNLDPERRKQISEIAIAIQTAKRNGWDPYNPKASDVERIDERLLKLQAIEAKGWAENDDAKVMKSIVNQLGYLRLRIWLTSNAGKSVNGPPLDVTGEENVETVTRLMEARRRRNEGLGLDDDKEMVIDAEAEKTGD